MNNIHNVEKAMQKYQQLAKDAQSNGDPVLAQNYLQHADHYLRRYNELNDKRESAVVTKDVTSNIKHMMINVVTYSRALAVVGLGAHMLFTLVKRIITQKKYPK